jgi:hypothetical protein
MNEKSPAVVGRGEVTVAPKWSDGAVHQKEMHPGGRTASGGLDRLGVTGDFDFAMGASEKKRPRTRRGSC